ncbi:MAG: putative CXXCH cytochrome family protein [Candidatus Azotimanducaceae bacterium]
MRLIVRYIVSKTVQQSIFDGSAASIGRGTDQVIQIADRRLPLAHSTLSVNAGKLMLSANGEHRFTVNDLLTKRTVLLAGDEVDISGHQLRILAGEGDADYVIEVERSSEKVESLQNRFTTRIMEVGVPERRIAWALFLSIFAIGLLIPASGFFMGQSTLEMLRSSPLPDDGIWLTGSLHQTHSFMGDDCSYCHTEAFTQTKDEDCLSCHLSVNHHFDTEAFGQSYGVGEECGDCHKEHSETDSITREDQKVCTTCHEDLEGSGFSGTDLLAATDFLDDHPSFKVSVDEYGEDGQWQRRRVDVWDEDLIESSNLKFPHDIHLSEDGIDGVEGKVVMACQDCHLPEKGGLKMRPVTMEKHCADCHQLTFDPSTPDRVVPHGSPPDLMRTLREYYAYQFISRDQPKPQANNAQLEIPISRDVRRPGRFARTQSISDLMAETQIDDSKPLTQQANDFIEARVNDAASNLFEKQTCTICHEITEVEDLAVPWQVTPVRLNTSWMPLSVFSHSSHKNMQCDGCHDAEFSSEAGDVLMPDIGSCRSCHGGEHADNLLQSSCISCHEFHLETEKPMGELLKIELMDSAQ